MIKQLGRRSFLAKTDIKSTFRIIPIRPSDYDLLGIFWQGKFYYDRAMPMGCASFCRTFEMFSTALEWVAKKHFMIPHLIHILDDYLMAASTYHQCRINLFVSYLYVNIWAYRWLRKKLWGPQNILSFAGIELDTLRMEACVPVDKTEKCRLLISLFLHYLTKGITAAHYYICLTKSVKADLSLWQTFMLGFNGQSFFLNDVWQDSLTLNLYTDVAARLGYGMVIGNECCFGAWPENWKQFNITILEFYQIVLSVLLWGDRMSNQRITFFTDNAALVDIINKATSRDSTVMIFVQQLGAGMFEF
jgi:hypothetical protein